MFPISRQFESVNPSLKSAPKRLPPKVASNYKQLEDMIDLQLKQAKLNKLQQELNNPGVKTT